MDRIAAETAHHMALVPFAFLVWKGVRGDSYDAAWWWVAGAFLVSWFTDSLAHYVHPNVLSLSYPIAQCALIGMVLLNTHDAARFFFLLCGVGMLAAILSDGGPDILLRSVAFGGVALMAYTYTDGAMRAALLTYFAGGLAFWVAFVASPSYGTWLAYQGTRLAGIALFCLAASRPVPRLRLA